MHSNAGLRVACYTPDQYPAVKRLLQAGNPEYGAPDYFYYSRELYEWLFRGFGSDDFTTLLMYLDDELVGCRGAQPGLYQVPLPDGSYVVAEGNGLTGWQIRMDIPELKGKGLWLHLKAQESREVVMACFFGHWSDRRGTNVTGPAFKASGFTMLDSLQRYVLPLHLDGYLELLSAEVSRQAVSDWLGSIEDRLEGVVAEGPRPVDPEAMHTLWERISAKVPLFGIHRTRDYWQWRYADSPAYSYFMWGDADTGAVIGRVDRIFTRENHEFVADHPLYGRKTLRIIEVLPSSELVWRGEPGPSFTGLLLSVLRWAREEGCLAVDFQCSSDWLADTLSQVGFREQDVDYKPDLCSLSGLFGPLRPTPSPINAAWRVKIPEHPGLNPGVAQTYVVKSDVAGDYPKFWPLPDDLR